jgi:hypothetical protein
VPGYTANQTLAASQGIFVLSGTAGQWNPWAMPGATAYGSGQVQVNLIPGWNLVYAPDVYRGLNGDDISREIGPGGTNPCGLQEVVAYVSGSYQTYTPTGGPVGTGFHVPTTIGMWIACSKAYVWTPS